MIWLLFVLFPLISGYGICPPGSQYDSDDQLCYTLLNGTLSWIDATSSCSSLNGTLIAPRHAFDEYSTVQITRDFGVVGTWLGIYGDPTGRWFDYTTGRQITYNHWGSGQPSVFPACAYMTGSGDWVAMDCQTSSNAVCESRPSNYSVPTTTTQIPIQYTTVTVTRSPLPPTINPLACPGYATMVDSTPCPSGYHFYLKTCSCYGMSTTTVEWFDAEDHCVQYNGHLTSIHSAEEAAFILGLTSDSTQMIQVGLHHLGSTWEWTDGTPTDYLDWAVRGPDPNYAKSACGFVSDNLNDTIRIYPSNYYFASYLGNGPCTTKYNHAVCKIPLI